MEINWERALTTQPAENMYVQGVSKKIAHILKQQGQSSLQTTTNHQHPFSTPERARRCWPYKISCTQRNFVYCGQTERSLKIRIVDLATTERTRRRNISEASGVMVAVLQTLSPSYPGELWKDLRDWDKICEALNVTNRTKLNDIAAKKSEMRFLKPTATLQVEM